jgi:hypothetical protein
VLSIRTMDKVLKRLGTENRIQKRRTNQVIRTHPKIIRVIQQRDRPSEDSDSSSDSDSEWENCGMSDSDIPKLRTEGCVGCAMAQDQPRIGREYLDQINNIVVEGIRTGDVLQACKRAADFYEKEIRQRVNRIPNVPKLPEWSWEAIREHILYHSHDPVFNPIVRSMQISEILARILKFNIMQEKTDGTKKRVDMQAAEVFRKLSETEAKLLSKAENIHVKRKLLNENSKAESFFDNGGSIMNGTHRSLAYQNRNRKIS